MKVSQPSNRLSALQSAKPELQAPLQAKFEHVRVTILLPEHTMPQPPQWSELVATLVSQPSLTASLQFAMASGQISPSGPEAG